MDWSHWWYKQAADVVLPSTALAIGSKMSDKHTSSSTIQVKNLWKTISVEEKLDIINQLEKGLRIVDICCNVWFAHSSICTIPDNGDRIKESAKLWSKVFIYQDYLRPNAMNCTKSYGCESLTLKF